RVDVVVVAEALPVANGAYGEHLGNLVAGQPAGEIEVVHVHVPEDAATRGDVVLGRRFSVVGYKSQGVQRPQLTGHDRAPRRAVVGVMTALEAHLDGNAGLADQLGETAALRHRDGERLLAQ